MERDRLTFVTSMYKKNPTDSFLAFAAAVEHQMAGNRKRAIEICESIIDEDPEYVDTYYKLGKMFENSNKIDQAKKTYKAGKVIANKTKNQKSIGELTEALMFLDEEEGNW
jgi:tetratricopeptide (TPR) repeat protein